MSDSSISLSFVIDVYATILLCSTPDSPTCLALQAATIEPPELDVGLKKTNNMIDFHNKNFSYQIKTPLNAARGRVNRTLDIQM